MSSTAERIDMIACENRMRWEALALMSNMAERIDMIACEKGLVRRALKSSMAEINTITCSVAISV